MFKRKQDVDKHVNAVLSRKKDDKERNAQGFQIAKLYVEVKEFTTAKKYLSGFLRLREDVPQAHQLLGDINIALGKKDEAIDNYKKALSLGGGFANSNRQLVKKICELYCESNADVQEMKFWLDKCEALCPKDDVIFKLKVKITDAMNGDVENNSVNKENLIASELVNQPTNKELRIRLLSSYLESGKLDEAYENAVKTDLTTAFVDQLQWYELLSTVFQEYGSKNPDSHSEPSHNEHFLHILRNLTYLSLWKKDVTECVYALNRFDKYLKKAFSLANQDESWIAMLKEMKGQLFFLSALLLLKKAQNGLLKWQEANQMAGACFLASRTVSPLDAQAPWFVTAPQDHSKFYNWWYLQSYDRLSQVGHMLLRLSNGDMVEWTRTIKQHVMTAAGHQKIFRATFSPRDLKDQGQASFFFQVTEMSDSTDTKEPLTERHMLDIDRVAYQVHLSDLSHLVWLCLQRYSPDKEAQPNYHFNILENIQYSVKNVDNAGAESLCQLDVLVFLLATVKCASSSLTENKYLYDDNSGQPSLLPLCLSKPLCTQDQNEWWTTAYKFCTNSLKEDFSKYRRVLIRGIETVRLLGTHGMSIPMTTHIAKSLDAKVSSIEKAELGCRCPASELSALETRAAYYWEKVKQMLEKLDRNQFTPVSKNRLFKEAGDSEKDLPARLIKKLTAESTFALSVAAMKQGRYEEALNGFSKHTSPWAKYHSAQIYKSLAEQEERHDEYSPKKQILLQKAQESLYGVMDKLAGDKSHQLNVLVSREMDAIESQIHSFEYDDREASSSSSFHTPSKYPGEIKSTPSTNGPVHSTPRNLIPSSYAEKGFDTAKGTPEPHLGRRDFNVSSTSDHHDRPRPSPERLESQIRSLTHSQSSLFKMVLDRNEELILINGKMMEELRDNNNQLKSVLTENKSLMEELKNFLVDNRDTMKEIKSELTALKAGHIAAATPPIPPAQPLFMPPIPATAPARGPYPGYPAPAYSGYVINGPVPPPQAPPLAAAGPHYRPTGLPGSRSSNVGKYRQSEEEDEEEEDLGAIEREYFDTDQSYTQYYPADSHMIQDWSVSGRTGLDGQPPMPIPALQQRMTMPAPGYFASALRGQALQYAQSTPSPGQVNPQLGPGFFSTPAAPGIVATPVVPVSLGISPINTVKPADSTPTLMVGALPGHGSITKGITKPVLPSSSSEMSSARNTESRVKSLFQARAVMEPKKTPGNITISFDTLVNRATILMMSDSKEILFHHDINGIKLEPSFVPTNVVWTGIKVGSQEAERMSVALENAGLASQLKDALQKAAYLIQTEVSPAQAVSTTPSAPATVPAVAATFTTQDAGKEVPKPTFGGFTFSTKPTVQENTERPKSILAKSSPAAAPVTDSPKPFAGFSLTPSSAATKPEVKFTLPAKSDVPSLFSTKSPGEVSRPAGAVQAKGPVVPPAKSPGALPKSPGATDDDHVEEYEPNVEFKPVISLPELVDKKTGEENEMEVFVERCRLFRFDHDSKQWKERGVGEMKILKSKDNVKFRIIMRRDQILKLCANHFLNATMHLTPMATSDRAWCYSAMDFSEEEMKLEQLAVKFKNAEKASLFQTVFEDCCRQLKDAESSSSTESKDDVKDKGQTPRVSTDSAKQPTNANKPLSELFKPKTGSWECQGCYIRSNDDVLKCPACGTAKPGGAAAPVSKPAVASTATKPAGASSSAVKPLSELFKPSTGSWECDACLVRNKADVVKCLACNTLKPGAKVTEAPQSSSGAANIASITGGAAGTGFNFGAASSSTPAVSTTGGGFSFSTPAASSSSSSGFKFGSPATFGGSPAPSGGFKFGAANAPSSTPVATTPSLSDAKPGTGSGFKFDAQSTSSATPGFSFGPASEQKGPSSGFVFGTSSLKPSALGAPVSNLFGAPAPAATSGGSIFGAPRAATPGSGSIFGGAAPAATPGSSVFGAPTPSANSFSSDKAPVKEGSKGPDTSGLLAKLLTSDDTPSSTTKPQSGFSFTMPAKPSTPVANQSAASTPGFQFSFNKSPAKSGVPQSPEVDDHGLYVNKEGDDSHIHFEPVVALPDKVEVKTGEEDENILFENRGKMYRFVSGEWKEKGVGVLKILEHKATKKTRVLMRRDQVLKICCNHMIDSALSLQPMAKSEGKAWVWYALDFTEEGGQMEQLAIRFRTAEIAFEFKTVFEKCRDSASSTSPAKPPVDLSKHGAVKKELFQADVDDSASDDVIFLGEEKPTQDQLDRARKYQLPDHFYLYERRPPCPGCIGCNDGELPAATAVAMYKPTTAGTVSTPTTAATVSTSTKQDTVAKPLQVLQSPAFGRAIVPTAGDTPTRKESSGFVLGANINVDFSSLASSTSSQGFTWQKAETSSPFKFAGAGQKLFGGGGSPAADGKGDAEDGEDGSIVQSDDIHFEPVIPLPDLVEVKTGEEDWSPLFCQRAKLYKFDKSLGQWKERGIGDMKIMSHKTEHMYRILQRREQVLKVSCNHLINVDMDLKPMATSETSWCWVATDYTETEPSIEQFAVKFKNKEIANQFREIFSECQENLRQEPVSSGPEAVRAHQLDDGDYVDSGVVPGGQFVGMTKSAAFEEQRKESAMKSVSVTPLGDKGNRHHTKALDVSGQDEIKAASFTPLGEKARESPMKSVSVTPLGDKGNRHHTKALDVSGQDEITAASFTPLGEKARESPMKSVSVTPLGDKGNRHHTKALDVSWQDEITAASFTPLGEKARESPMKSVSVTPLGDKGNRHHTKALDVSGQDEITAASFTPLGEKARESPMKSVSVTPLGDKGNRHHTKALDVSGQDEITPASYTPLGEKPKESPLKSVSVTPLGDKGNRHHTKALDVSGQDEITPASYTPLGEKARESPMKSVSVTPLGDKGNRHHTKALDVSGQDEITAASFTPLGEKARESPMKSVSVTPLGDKGNRHHTKALDVSGQDEITPASYTPLGEKARESPLKSVSVTPLGDKGNRHHTKALDVSGQDEITPASYAPLGEKPRESPLKSVSVTPLGDKGNRHHTKALDVSGQDEITAASFTPLGEKARESPMKSVSVTPLGDKGNRHHTKALDVSGQDEITPASYTPLGEKPKESPLKSVSVTPLGDKGNRHHTKALDVSGQDEITPASYTPLGEKARESPLKSVSVTPLGDKGNRHHTKALDVSGQDEITSASFTPLGEKARESPLKSVSVTPLGDKGNRHHTKALDVSGQDEITSASFTPLGEKARESPMKSVSVTPLGDKGNRHHTKALDVSGQDEITPASYTPLGEKARESPMKSVSVTPLGDKGNRHHTKALDVSGQDEITSASFTPLGEKARKSPMKSVSVTPLGDKGNRHHTKALDVSGQDEITPASYTPLGSLFSSVLQGPRDSTGDVVEDVTGEVGEDVTGEVVEDVTGEEGGEDYEEYEEEEEEEEEDDRDKVLLEKRVTLSSLENGSWKKLGLGNLLVKYNEDLGGNSIEFNTDGGEKLCNHVICQEHAVSVDLKKHACEWKPIDYSTDDPIRKHFSAAFSSSAAAQEFAQIFTQSQQLAAESEISENVLKEIDIPEIFSAGEAS